MPLVQARRVAFVGHYLATYPRPRRYARMLATWHRKHLGCSVLTLRTRAGGRLALTLFDGGGYVVSTGVWKLDGWALWCVEAGQA
jgi:hypothetical protein